ncbi:MAG TPA: diguanylate cyclase [Deinococcales bacterium]|nr:diguanylate cyclase [Deinococcales bacterium]
MKGQPEKPDLYRSVFESLDAGLFLLDARFAYAHANRAWLEAVGCEMEDLAGRVPSFLADAQPDGGAGREMLEALKAGQSVHRVARARRKDGQPLWVFVHLSPLPGGEGFAGVANEVQALREAQARVERDAAMDALTGLPNRRAFDAALALEYARAVRHSYRLSVLLFDFSSDLEVGPALPDATVRTVGLALRTDRRASDLAFRIGPEQFALLLPNTGASEAAFVAERACRGLHTLGLPARVVPRLGSAVFPDDAGDANGLVLAASNRLDVPRYLTGN